MAGSSNRNPKLPASLIQVKKRFAHWRQAHPKRTRFSEELWSAAVAVAREYGHNKTAKALGLDYYSLKKRLSSPPPLQSKQNRSRNTASFIELIPPPISSECMIEIEDFENKRIRVSLKACSISDIAALVKSLRRESTCSR